jgi:hypothetical protein
LFISILVIFSTANMNAQTTVYIYPESQPMPKGSPFNISKILTIWAHCAEESTGGEKVYRAYKNEPSRHATSQPNYSAEKDCHHFDFGEYASDYYNGGASEYYEYEGDVRVWKGAIDKIDDDNNVVIRLRDGNKLLLITDRLMEGVLVVRKL